MSEIKMMIVVRKDLNMRKGKMVAQGCHAAVGLCLDLECREALENGRVVKVKIDYNSWVKSSFKKICVSVNSEEELLEVLAKAESAGLSTKLIVDAGHTEFKGVPTITCGAILGSSEELSGITGDLPLL